MNKFLFTAITLLSLISFGQVKIKGGANTGFSHTGFYEVRNYNTTYIKPTDEYTAKEYPKVLNQPITFWCLADNGAILKSKNQINLCDEKMLGNGDRVLVNCKVDYFSADRSQAVPGDCLASVDLGSDVQPLCTKYKWTPAPDSYTVKNLANKTVSDGVTDYDVASTETYRLPDCQ